MKRSNSVRKVKSYPGSGGGRTSQNLLGFSLLELLVVIALMALLMTLTMPAITSVLRTGEMNRAGQILSDEIALARQEASSKNRAVELRIVDMDLPLSNETGWKGIQLWISNEIGEMEPLGRLRELPGSVVIASDDSLSPLLEADQGRSGTAFFGSHGDRDWRGFRMRPGGGMDQGVITPDNNFLTLVSIPIPEQLPPDNYFAIRINPVTGRVSTHRP